MRELGQKTTVEGAPPPACLVFKSVLASKGRLPIPKLSGSKCINVCLTLQEASELEVCGFEVNKGWWEGPHSTPHYIPLGKPPHFIPFGKFPSLYTLR